MFFYYFCYLTAVKAKTIANFNIFIKRLSKKLVRQSHFQKNLISKSNNNVKNYIFADNFFSKQNRINFSLRADTNISLLIILMYISAMYHQQFLRYGNLMENWHWVP